jgi:2-succinyl-5-enolpyruvyl-6-hydroxy-3-cyclohexene-1-carboxylate synthase
MSDPQSFIAEHFPRLYLWLTDLRDSAHFLMIGMASVRESFDVSDMTKIVMSVAVSAFASSYVTTERTAVKLEQYAAMQSEFRNEVRQYMREHEVKNETLRDRVTRIESANQTVANMNGMNGGRK